MLQDRDVEQVLEAGLVELVPDRRIRGRGRNRFLFKAADRTGVHFRAMSAQSSGHSTLSAAGNKTRSSMAMCCRSWLMKSRMMPSTVWRREIVVVEDALDRLGDPV